MTLTQSQTLTLTVTTPVGESTPSYAIGPALRAFLGIDSVTVDIAEFGEVIEQKPELNTSKLLELLGWASVEQEKKDRGLPSEWNQGAWLARGDMADGADNWCGSACCIAGKAALGAGAQPIWTDNGEDGWWLNDSAVMVGDRRVGIPEYGREVLGLTSNEASRLFDGSNNLGNLRSIVLDLIESRKPKPAPKPEPEPAPVVDSEPEPPAAEPTPEPPAAVESSIYLDPSNPQDCPYNSVGCDCNVRDVERDRRRVQRLMEPALAF